MLDLPSGTVTFLFTDIEGSTRLLQGLRERYGELLEEHHRLLRAAFADAGGDELGTQGDAFFVAFARAKDAVAGAVAAQRALAAHAWPDGVEVRVRMGLHTGEPSRSEAGPVSLAVHRAARIAAAGHGGQVLLSSTTRDLVEDELPADVGVRDLGEHRLKDIDRPERIHQLVIAGLPEEFPPLTTLGSGAMELEALVPRRPRRSRLLAAVLALALAAAATLALLALRRDDGVVAGPRVTGDAVAVIDPDTNGVTGSVPAGVRPSDLAFGAGSLWVTNLDDRTISRIDPVTLRMRKTIVAGAAPRGVAASNVGVWFASATTGGSAVTVRRVNPRFDTVDKTIQLRGTPGLDAFGDSIALDGATVWVVPQGRGGVSRIDARTGEVTTLEDVGVAPTAVAVGLGATWVTDVENSTVLRIDPTNVVTDTIELGGSPAGIAVGAGAVWVAQFFANALVRIDPETKSVTTTIPVGRSPIGVAVGAGSVWVANSRDGTVSRIDPQSNDVSAVIPVGGSPQFVAVSAGRVWVTVQEAAPGGQDADARDAIEVATEISPESLDPAFATDPVSRWLSHATCAHLVNYPDRSGPEGARVAPEVAAAPPEVSADRLTYTFTIRKGFRFSPPSREPVTAASFAHAIERTLDPDLSSPGSVLGRSIVGFDAFRRGAERLAGVTARGDRLTIRLSEPVPDLLSRLADPYLCAVPTDTPVQRLPTVPSAGPYYVSALRPGQSLVLEPNPGYGGTRPHRLERITVRFGIGRSEAVAAVESGDVDFAADGVPPAEYARLAAAYGTGSAPAKAGRQQYFVRPVLSLEYLVLNAHRPLFSDVRMRKAVNFAIDRTALADQGSVVGGAGVPGEPTDQYLPPDMPGFRDVRIYPPQPDVATARRLTRGRRATAVLYICDREPCPQYAQIVSENLRAIGIETRVEVLPFDAIEPRLQRRAEPFDLAYFGYATDSPDPGAFLRRLAGEHDRGRHRSVATEARSRRSGHRPGP